MASACALVENISLNVSTSGVCIAEYNCNRSERNSSLGTTSAMAISRWIDARGKLTLNLKAGTYLLLCNQPGHYKSGMSTKLVVEK